MNSYFQLEGISNIFAVGDVTALEEEKTAERAIVHGEFVAENIKRFMKRKAMAEEGYVPRHLPCNIYSTSLIITLT